MLWAKLENLNCPWHHAKYKNCKYCGNWHTYLQLHRRTLKMQVRVRVGRATMFGQYITLGVISLLITLCASEYLLDTGFPCLFNNSINITEGGHMDADNNYHHKGVTYSPQYYGYFGFKDVNGSHVRTETHIRGCICDLKKNCIRLCCDPFKGPCPAQYDGFVEDTETGEISYSEDLTEMYPVVYGSPACNAYLINRHDGDNHTIVTVRTCFIVQIQLLSYSLFLPGRLSEIRLDHVWQGYVLHEARWKPHDRPNLFLKCRKVAQVQHLSLWWANVVVFKAKFSTKRLLIALTIF